MPAKDYANLTTLLGILAIHIWRLYITTHIRFCAYLCGVGFYAICARGGMMKVVAFVPIKLHNERTPGKNLKTFYDGTPLVHFVQKTLLQCKDIDERYIFCSSESIKPYILDGIKFLKRSENLDSKETLCGDLIRAFINAVDSDIYIMAHATLPFVRVETYENCIKVVKDGLYTSSMPALKIQNLIWFRNAPLNFKLDKPPRTQDLEPIFSEVASPCVFYKDVFFKYGNRSGDKHFFYEVNHIEAIDIDYPQDFEFANLVYKNLLNGGGQ
ncbi:cytidylyltransferase domain-containing protein [uncultured Helicobacter sp.]|uniref:acylneuraminate cytidylyltransferase family protein n=1 Tax=uncultured Helicobacter sp. TaxID=175537 RepID=UPI00374EF16B